MEKIISKQALPEWVKKLENYTIYAPVKKEDHWSFEVVGHRDPEAIDLNYLNSTPPPKKVFFPQREVLFEFDNYVKETLPEEKPRVILGLRPCDAKAITLLDKVFGEDFQDPYYLKRRNKTILVGLGCAVPPSPNCFCTSVGGSPHGKTGLDILVTDLGDDYYLETITPGGDRLVDLGGELSREPKSGEQDKMKSLQTAAGSKIQRQIKDVATITARLGESKMFSAPLWDEESRGCIRCGICTYLCPSCHCFDINDEVDGVSPLAGKRVRTWDNCQFPDFTMHSSGHNPRPDKLSRLRRRILHKFPYFVRTQGDYMCTGCGRCVSGCPVGIDMIEILDKVRDNER